MRWIFSIAAVAGLLVAGCEAPSSSSSGPGGSQAKDSAPAPPPLVGAPGKTATAGSGATQTPAGSTTAEPGVVREKAVVGVGKKGRDYEPGLVTTPVSIYFRGPQMMAFRIQIPDAMNKFKGINGHYPKSHEEFMQKIIKENMIKLPDLLPGQRYVYDAKKAAQMRTYDPADPPLFVEHAK